MNEEMIFTVLDENGNEMECEVVFYFHNDATDKDYLIYTDNKTDAAGNTQLYASIYQPDDPNTALEPVETEAEWAAIEKELLARQKQARRLFQK